MQTKRTVQLRYSYCNTSGVAIVTSHADKQTKKSVQKSTAVLRYSYLLYQVCRCKQRTLPLIININAWYSSHSRLVDIYNCRQSSALKIGTLGKTENRKRRFWVGWHRIWITQLERGQPLHYGRSWHLSALHTLLIQRPTTPM